MEDHLAEVLPDLQKTPPPDHPSLSAPSTLEPASTAVEIEDSDYAATSETGTLTNEEITVLSEIPLGFPATSPADSATQCFFNQDLISLEPVPDISEFLDVCDIDIDIINDPTSNPCSIIGNVTTSEEISFSAFPQNSKEEQSQLLEFREKCSEKHRNKNDNGEPCVVLETSPCQPEKTSSVGSTKEEAANHQFEADNPEQTTEDVMNVQAHPEVQNIPAVQETCRGSGGEPSSLSGEIGIGGLDDKSKAAFADNSKHSPSQMETGIGTNVGASKRSKRKRGKKKGKNNGKPEKTSSVDSSNNVETCRGSGGEPTSLSGEIGIGGLDDKSKAALADNSKHSPSQMETGISTNVGASKRSKRKRRGKNGKNKGNGEPDLKKSPCQPEKTFPVDSIKNKAAHPQNEVANAGQTTEDTMNVQGCPVEQNGSDILKTCKGSGDEPTSQGGEKGVDGFVDKTQAALADASKHSPSQMETANSTNVVGAARKKKRNRKTKNKKNALVQTKETVQKETLDENSLEPHVSSQPDNSTEDINKISLVVGDQDVATKEKQAASDENQNLEGLQNDSKEATSSLDSSTASGKDLKSASEKRKRKSQSEQTISPKKFKLPTVAAVKFASKSDVPDKARDLNVSSTSLRHNVDSDNPREERKIKYQPEMDPKARATGVSRINRGKRENTTKETPTKDQSATTYKPARSDTARQNHKAIQRKGESKSNDDNANVSEPTQTNQDMPQSSNQNQSTVRLIPVAPYTFAVHSHVIIPKEVSFNPRKDKMYIQFGNGFEMLQVISIRNLDKNGQLLHSCLFIEPSYKGIPIKYWYSIDKGQRSIEEIAARTLHIPWDLHEEEWHQYDGIMNVPQVSIFRTMRNFFTFGSSPDERILQLMQTGQRAMLEEIFELLSSLDREKFKQFNLQIHHFKKCIRSLEFGMNWVHFNEGQVNELINEQLQKLLSSHATKDSKKGKQCKKIVKNPFMAGLLVFVIRNNCSLTCSTDDLITICRMLQLPEKIAENVDQDLREIATIFPLRSYICLGLINMCIQKEVMEFVLVVPFLHWCVEQNRPAHSMNREASSSGLEPLHSVSSKTFRDNVKKHPDKRRKVMNLMFQNKHLTETDSTLVLSWFSFITTADIPEYAKHMGVSLKYVSEQLMNRLKECELKPENAHDRSVDREDIEAFGKNISYIKEMVIQETQRRDVSGLKENELNWSNKMHLKICQLTRGALLYEVPALSFQLVLKVAEKLKMLLAEESQSESPPEEKNVHVDLKSVIESAQGCLRSWRTLALKKPLLSPTKSIDKNELEVWNCHFTLEYGVEDWAIMWRKMTRIDLMKRIQEENPFDQILIYWNEKESLTTLNHILLDCFETCALTSVDAVCESKMEAELLAKLDACKNQKSPAILSKLIEKSWQRNPEQRTDDISCVLSSDSAIHYCLLQGDCSKLNVSQEARGLIKEAEKRFHMLAGCLCNGSVKFRDLQELLQKRKEFMGLFQAHQKNPLYEERSFLRVLIEPLLSAREEELKAFQNEKNAIGTLLKMIHKIVGIVTVTDITILEESYKANVQNRPLNELVRIESWTGEQTKSRPAPDVKYFNVSSDIKAMAFKMQEMADSIVVSHCWEEAARASNYDEETLNDLCSSIWDLCFTDYTNLCEKVESGAITFLEVDRMFYDLREHPDEIEKELAIMFRVVKGISLPQERLRQIKEYYKLHLAADSARMIQNMVTELELQGDFRKIQNLAKLNGPIFKQQPLNYVDKDLINTKKDLEKITPECIKCLDEFIRRQPFIKWVKEALTNLREVKVFVDLASISAGENDMEVDRVACFHDAIMGYSPFIYGLQQKTDFKTLRTSVEEIQKALFSDPKLPAKLVDSARYLEWLKTLKECHGSVETSSMSLAAAINNKGIYTVGNIEPQHKGKLSLGDVLRLHLCDESTDELKVYALQDLEELQNKLMLMSGKRARGKEEVARFMENFNNVQRLGIAFIELYTSGNMLYRNWKAQVYCSKESDTCLTMDFHARNIECLRISGDISEQLQILCRALETCLQEWHEFMGKRRATFYHLNYYTAEQIVYLCSELGSFAAGNLLSEQVLAMLSFIKPHCTAKEIGVVMHQADAVDVGIDALQEVEESQEFDASLKEADMSKASYQRENANLPKAISLLWTRFMGNMTAFLIDHLDTVAFGKLLSQLSALNATIVRRQFPSSLHCGRPNLLTCSRPEIFKTALCTYMQNPEQPLPSYDEVLLCSEETTCEEVELFLRRALSRGSLEQKIYTLIHADCLNYETSVRFGELFEELTRHCNPVYQLVVICDDKRQHCYIPSYLCHYKVPIGLNIKPEAIQQYLVRHFTVSQRHDSAADVFHDNLSVRIISSKRPGMGKSLYVDRLYQKLVLKDALKRIRLIEPKINEGQIVQKLQDSTDTCNLRQPMIIHIDAAPVRKGLEEFLFKILVLGVLKNSQGRIWKRSTAHLYLVEHLNANQFLNKPQTQQVNMGLLSVLPTIHCQSPKEVLELEKRRREIHNILDPLMDEQEFISEAIQRPFQYLLRFNANRNIDNFTYTRDSVEEQPAKCLTLFLHYCGLPDPSWAELRNFSWFLNLQLKNCETSMFCNPNFVGDTLVGFKKFIVEFMILMARDFATPSMNISDESVAISPSQRDDDLRPYKMRKRWESHPHPYIFFNADGFSMTFLGFHLKKSTNGYDAVDHRTGQILRGNVMSSQLEEGLNLQRIRFNEDFDEIPRKDKIRKLCLVLGVSSLVDPDDTYELTADNVMKMLAIHMRFRCDIPVIVMGETGCGKTRLIKFLCDLQKGDRKTENMKLIKVHGGTTAESIYVKIAKAEDLAIANKQRYNLETVLFFDEANTTEAIHAIKEVLCDKTVRGKPLKRDSGLKIIAACNPYRKHSAHMIERLEKAGLGYRVKAEETEDKLGKVPLRQLVYRVQPLPPSMIPLVWDFGQLSNDAELAYTCQIVKRYIRIHGLPFLHTKAIIEVLATSQCYMRQKQDECSFVSLRDVERCMKVLAWFYEHRELLFPYPDPNVNILQSLIMSVSVCYYPTLMNKETYLKLIAKHLPDPYNTSKAIQSEIVGCQDQFMENIKTRERIAKNEALKENVFLMVICIELRIPLFLVGKPGSSKSLAKTVVLDAMQGQSAHCPLFKKLKQVHMVSFQCSPHSTPEGIINTFKQCARFQQSRNLKEYASVVVLDEIGLAEDSPQMPLKTLHPLLEDGCIDDEDPLPHQKVGFIGISNWALDPAKMNRGIFVSRLDPCQRELIETAKGICSSDKVLLQRVQQLFPGFAKAYLGICQAQGGQFFGLRDYYSLIKMVFIIAKETKCEPTESQLADAILRNFSGKDGFHPLGYFLPGLGTVPQTSTLEMVKKNITADSTDGECRYLLLLTKNYIALQIVLQHVFQDLEDKPEIIFGSSFPKDQEYTQVCRNVNRVKICMEIGRTIILLNLKNLYESLYDALNQYYVYLGEYQYVDLGLGTHRVKCRVDKKFRLIVIEDKDVVYKQFPIPLINRLEKHSLDMSTVLTLQQRGIAQRLEVWVGEFVSMNKGQDGTSESLTLNPSEVVIGFHADACASVLLQVLDTAHLSNDSTFEDQRAILKSAKCLLLNCATPDAVVRLERSKLGDHEIKEQWKEYFVQQHHRSLSDYIHQHLSDAEARKHSFVEVTTFSRLLTKSDINLLDKELGNVVAEFVLLSLHQFDTEYSFCKKIREAFQSLNTQARVLLIQMDTEESSQSTELIASAKYCTMNEMNLMNSTISNCYVYFITKLSRLAGGSSYIGFQGGQWLSVHIDDVTEAEEMGSDISAFYDVTISELFANSLGIQESDNQNTVPEDTEDEQQVKIHTGRSKILNTTFLLQSCIQSAVSTLRDGKEECSRNTQRVQILLDLLSEEDECEVGFLRTVTERLMLQLQEREEVSLDPKKWMCKEALKIKALQEGGTFRHTIWKCIQNSVTPNLAQLISILDRDCNLNLLVDPNVDEDIKRLWLNIFSDTQILRISHQPGNSGPNAGEVTVERKVSKGSLDNPCAAPFSWLIKEYIDQLWTEFRFLEGATDRNKAKMLKFVESFNKSKLGEYIANLSEEGKRNLGQRYLTDFILMTIDISSCDELKIFKMAFISCLNELHSDSEPTLLEHSPTWIHIAYNVFKKRLQNLSNTFVLYPKVLECFRNWRPGALDSNKMTLDLHAAYACAEMAQAVNIETVKDCKQLMEIMETVQPAVELVFDKNYLKPCRSTYQQIVSRIRTLWDSARVLCVFIEHVVLTAGHIDCRLQDIAVKHCSLLQKILRTSSDMKDCKTVEGVIEVLQSCNEMSSLLDHRYGIKECPVCLGMLNDPACLPCEHVFCIECLERSLAFQRVCPKCKAGVPSSDEIQVSTQLKTAIKKHNDFRQRCNMFFMEVVSTFCFSEDSPPSDQVIKLLLALLIAVSNSPEGDLYRTRTLTPFSECVDINPVIRSVLLKLLMHYSFDEVKDFLQTYLSNLEEKICFKDHLKELYLLFIKCFEDSVFGHFERCGGLDDGELLKQNCNFASRFARQQAATCKDNAIDYLQNIASIRFCFSLTARLMYEACNKTDINHKATKESFLEHMKMICLHSGNDWYRVYLMREVYDQYGMDLVQSLTQLEEYRWSFPDKIIEKHSRGVQLDCYVLCGETYKAVRDATTEAVTRCQMNIIADKIKGLNCSPRNLQVYLGLALFREVTCSFATEDASMHCNKMAIAKLQKFIKDSKILDAPNLKDFCCALAKNELGTAESSLRIAPDKPSQQRTLIEIIVHAALVLLCGNSALSSPLRKLAFNPSEMKNAYLPTMPEDLKGEARSWFRDKQKWYSCRCGEHIQVGQCGRPLQTTRCPNCDAIVGGINHRPTDGFTPLTGHTAQIETGHFLGPASRRDQVVAPDRQMTPVAFLLLRTLTHVSMLLGTVHHHQIIKEITRPAVSNVSSFLWDHLKKDLDQLGKSLGKNIDEVAICIHLVVDRLLNQPEERSMRWNEVLSSKQERNAWESQFIKSIISPLLENIDKRLPEVTRQMSSDDRIGGSPIVKMLYGDPSDFLTFPRDTLDCSSAWKCQRRTCIENFTHILEQKDGKNVTPILWQFLQKERYIRMLKYLPELIELQYELIRIFQCTSSVKSSKISQFLQQIPAGQQGQKHNFEKWIKIFLQLWNELRLLLAKDNPAIPQELHQDLTLDSPIEVLLPQQQGLGLCTTTLTKFLIGVQNDLIGAISERKKLSISPEAILDAHLILCDPDKDLIPIVLSNCQYTLEKGQETLPEYNVRNIERQLIRQFLQGKPTIVDSKIPKFVSRRERDYLTIFKELKSKIPQKILLPSVCTAVTTSLKSYSDICDALDIIQIVAGFLATAGGGQDYQLLAYLKETLRMDRRVLACVSKAFAECRLKHAISLWQLLSSWKSEVMLGTRKDPFERIPKTYAEDLLPAEEEKLKTFFASTDINAFIWELHEILMLKTAQSNENDNYRPNWGLKETISIYLEHKGIGPLSGMDDNLPDDITLAKAIQTWKLAVDFKKTI
ncbi:E3 ubiquitin-protein ligase rnf213-alpha-like isoform X1 [Amblyraja radiata]|uniref:E3 ubiquitin-protein ligase rnf213-alpha-like isoform X1 n=1 Tax=Amblyraja radiata TaxID=386614 RepID=UPI001403E33F|nr:E3 ubiquitin-protein ligase rnf213-alpha-like isoform X1 [Amblyraja radiata]XP_032900201.1 E3 ubiquitin-protein ligase rnf213-alpha-like isoform X1 [Amblyraja radiata]